MVHVDSQTLRRLGVPHKNPSTTMRLVRREGEVMSSNLRVLAQRILDSSWLDEKCPCGQCTMMRELRDALTAPDETPAPHPDAVCVDDYTGKLTQTSSFAAASHTRARSDSV